MNLRDLEYLVAVADRRSFRQAAAACATKNSRRLLASVAASGFDDADDLAVLAWLALGQSLV